MSTYTPIASQTLGSTAASVTFSSIPQGYTDLYVMCNGQNATQNGWEAAITFNSDTGSNYSFTYVGGNGSTASSSSGSNTAYIPSAGLASWTTVANSPGIYSFNVMNYSNTTTYKTTIGRNGYASGTFASTDAVVGLWRNTNAITSITLTVRNSGTFASGSTFTLYGIQVGTAAQKAQGGNIVTSDGTYVYHTFTSSGSFTTNQALTVDYLVVAGGGGGGGVLGNGGGGGAGGLRSTVTATGGGGSLESALSLSSGKSYPVIVGAGGASGYTLAGPGGSGNDSVFATITSLGGGGGGVVVSGDAKSGGSGGGAGHPYPSALWLGGAGTANQGYAGGNGTSYGSPVYGGAGGGGAGAVGGNGSPSAVGNGGTGVAVAISGSSVYYAGGGGGGNNTSTASTGGAGGGGAGGANPALGVNGTPNTGGGGGGGGSSNTPSNGQAAAGGSGIVIIRYAL